MTAKTQRSILGIPGKRYVRLVILATEYDNVSVATTSYVDVSYVSLTLYDTYAGFGIMCDNDDIYCDSEDYYCDGSVVMRDVEAVTEETTVYGNRELLYRSVKP